MTLLTVYLALALGVSFLCSLLESVILSVTRPHIQLMIKEKRRGGRLLKSLKDEIDKPLAAILTLNTIANTFGAAGVGAQVHKLFSSEWVTASAAILTFSILVFSEIIPKTIGAAKWKKLAPTCAVLIKLLITITYPFVMLFRGLSRLIAPSGLEMKTLTREEMIVVAETGVEEGMLVEKEQKIIKNLLRLNAILVEDIMTPRSVIFALQQDLTVSEVIEQNSPIYFSRIPIYSDNIDEIEGMVLRYEIIEEVSEDLDNTKIKELKIPIKSVSEKDSVALTLDQFIRDKEHLYIVKDKNGVTLGIVTLEDVIETLLGVEIVDEFDSVEDMRKYALEQWENRKKSKKYKKLETKET